MHLNKFVSYWFISGWSHNNNNAILSSIKAVQANTSLVLCLPETSRKSFLFLERKLADSVISIKVRHIVIPREARGRPSVSGMHLFVRVYCCISHMCAINPTLIRITLTDLVAQKKITTIER